MILDACVEDIDGENNEESASDQDSHDPSGLKY